MGNQPGQTGWDRFVYCSESNYYSEVWKEKMWPLCKVCGKYKTLAPTRIKVPFYTGRNRLGDFGGVVIGSQAGCRGPRMVLTFRVVGVAGAVRNLSGF